MKSLKILTCSLILGIILNSGNLRAQAIGIKAGVYEFTDITASEFYSYAVPAVLVEGEVWKKNHLSLQLTSGLAFTQTTYKSNRHHLFMIPLYITVNYELTNSGAKIFPVLGMGLTFIEKIDKNKDKNYNFNIFEVGYHIDGKLIYRINEKMRLNIGLNYTNMIPMPGEILNINGITPSIGFCYLFNRKINKQQLQLTQ